VFTANEFKQQVLSQRKQEQYARQFNNAICAFRAIKQFQNEPGTVFRVDSKEIAEIVIRFLQKRGFKCRHDYYISQEFMWHYVFIRP